MRTILTKGLIALAITTSAALGADNSIGTWKLNAEKSLYTPAPMAVKNLAVTREASDGGVKVTTTGEQATGAPINASYTSKYDGADVQVTGNAPYDTVSISASCRRRRESFLNADRLSAGNQEGQCGHCLGCRIMRNLT